MKFPFLWHFFWHKFIYLYISMCLIEMHPHKWIAIRIVSDENKNKNTVPKWLGDLKETINEKKWHFVFMNKWMDAISFEELNSIVSPRVMSDRYIYVYSFEIEIQKEKKPSKLLHPISRLFATNTFVRFWLWISKMKNMHVKP